MTIFDIDPGRVIYNVYPIPTEYQTACRYLYCMENVVVPVEMLIVAVTYRLCGMDYPPMTILVDSIPDMTQQDKEILNSAFMNTMAALAPAIERFIPQSLRSLVTEIRVVSGPMGHNLVLGVLST